MAFLDVQTIKNSDCTEKSIFQKNTNLGILHKIGQLCFESIRTKFGLDVTAPVYSICNSAQLWRKEFQKISNLLEKNGFSLNYINWHIQHFLAKKQSKKKNKTDKKDDTKRSFKKLLYIKEMNGIYQTKLMFFQNIGLQSYIYFNETFNLKRLFTFKER